MDTLLVKLVLLFTGTWSALRASVLDARWSFAPGGQAMLVIGIPLAILVAILCYYRTTEGLTWRSRLSLSLLRFGALLSLLILVAGTVCIIEIAQSTRPKLVMVVDDSASMTLPAQQGNRLAEVDRTLGAGLQSDLESRFDVETIYTSGAKYPDAAAAARPQDLARTIVSSVSRLDHPPAEILVISDGTQSGSTALVRASGEVPAPLSTLYLEDPSNSRDLNLQSVSIPPFVYAHDRVMVTGQVRGQGVTGEANLTLVQIVNGSERPITTSKVTLRENNEPSVARLEWEAPDAGVARYLLRVTPLTDEITDRNNSIAFHVDVRGEKIRVLYVEGEPSWEYRYAKQALESDPAVEFYGLVRMPENEWIFQGNSVRPDAKATIKAPKNGFPVSPDELNYFDVLILGDIERKFFEQGDRFAMIENYVRLRGGGLVTLGGFKVYGAGDYEGTDLARMIPLEVTREKKLQLINRFNPQLTSQGLMHPLMQLEFDPQINEKTWASLPWVEGGNAIPAAKPGATTLLVHPTLRSKYGPRPVSAAWQYGRGRVYSTALDGTWHWRLARTTETDYHRRYWGLISRWLGGDPRTQKPISALTADDSVTEVDKQQTFSILVRDPEGNPLLDASAEFTIEAPTSGVTTIYSVVDPATPGRYVANFTPIEAGEHKVKVVVSTRTEQSSTQEQTYFAQESRREFSRTTCDAAAMQELAKASGGMSAKLSDWKNLKLPEHPDTVRSNVLAISLWQSPGLLIVLLVCLIGEWFLRKRRGLA